MSYLTAAYKLIGIRGLIGIGVALTLSVMLVLQVHKTNHWKHEAVAEKLAYQTEKVAFDQTVLNYRTAAETARQADAANAARVAAEQRAINERTKSDYEARIADARARADRLRSQLEAAAHPGRPAAAGVSHPGATSGIPDGPSAEDGFSVSDRLTATEQAIQLDELIKWVQKNLTVNYGNSSTSSPNGNH